MMLNYKQWVACAVFVALSSATMAQQAPQQPTDFTLSDNANDNVPVLVTQATSPCNFATGTAATSYALYKNPNVPFLMSNLSVFVVPDKSSLSAQTNDPLLRFTDGTTQISGLVICEGGDVTPSSTPLFYTINLDEGKSCNLVANSSDGIHIIEGKLSKSGTGTDTVYAVADGKCTYDSTSSAAPNLVNIKRTTPTTETTTDSSMSWTVEFSENVSGVDKDAFEITGATGMTLSVAAAANSDQFGYNVTASGGNFKTSGQAAFLKVASNNSIKEVNGSQQALASTIPSATHDNYYCYQSCQSGTTTGKSTKVETNKGILTSLKEEDISGYTTEQPSGMNFDLGTYSYKVENLNTTTAETVTITLTLAETVPTNAKIYKVTNSGYTELGSANNLVINGKTITFDITDNGPLDTNNTLGTIEDPVTVATANSATSATTNTTTAANSGSGSFGIGLLLAGVGLLGIFYRRRKNNSLAVYAQ